MRQGMYQKAIDDTLEDCENLRRINNSLEECEYEWMIENRDQCVICKNFRGTKLRIWCPACHHSYHPNCHRMWFETEDECGHKECDCNCLDID